MNTDRVAKETNERDERVEALSVEALDRVAGGLNPQPLPPGIRFLNPQPLPPGIYHEKQLISPQARMSHVEPMARRGAGGGFRSWPLAFAALRPFCKLGAVRSLFDGTRSLPTMPARSNSDPGICHRSGRVGESAGHGVAAHQVGNCAGGMAHFEVLAA